MDSAFREKGVYAAGVLRVDPTRRTVSARGAEVVLTGRLFETLLYFVQNPERLVPRAELEHAIWRGRVVEEGNLQKAISGLRRALGEADPDGKYIVTVPGRGFQFAIPVYFDNVDVSARSTQGDSNPSALAKLSPPRLPATIARPRLFSLLDRLTEGRVAWIMGPPGAGKTTLASSYREHAQLGGIWYVVDAGDGDPASFFYYLREAEGCLDGAAAPLPLLTAEYSADLPGFTRRFFRALSARLPPRSTLVLDNYQDAPETSSLSAILRDAAAELAPGQCFLVISRREPPAALARLRANQELGVLGWDDLKLTEQEVGEIAGGADPVLAAAAGALHARSGGWAAGLTLLLASGEAGLPARGGDAGHTGVGETPQAVFEYFASELFERAPDAVRRVCLATAYLPRFTSSDAAALSGRQDAQDVLEGLARRRTFTDRHAAGAMTYQYHALFAAFLQAESARVFTAEARLALMQQSAGLAAQAGDIETALSLHGRVGDWADAERLLLARAADIFAQGRWQTLLGWLRAFPEAWVEGSPWLGYWYGLCEGQSAGAAARSRMELVYQSFVRTGDIMGQALSACAITDSYLLDWRDLVFAQSWDDILRNLIRTHAPSLSPAIELRVYSTFLAVAAQIQPPYELLVSVLQRVWQLCAVQEIPAGDRLNAASSLVLFLSIGASSAMAEAAVDQFGDLVELPMMTDLQRCRWHFSRSFGYCCSGRFQDWKIAFRTARHIAGDAKLSVLPHWFDTLEAWLPLCEGRLEDAAEILLRWKARLHNASDAYYVGHYHTWEAWLALLQEKPTCALEHLRMPMQLTTKTIVSMQGITLRIVYAHALAENGRLEEAFEIATFATSFLASSADGILRFGSHAMAADILLLLGRREEALTSLKEAFATAKRGGHYNTIPWFPKVMTRLGVLALRENIETAFVAELGVRRNLDYGQHTEQLV